MRFIKLLLLLLAANCAGGQTITKFSGGEYVLTALDASGEVWVADQTTATPVYRKYPGIDSVTDVHGGQYHSLAIDQRGRVYQLGNKANVIQWPVDTTGAEFKDNFFIRALYRSNFTIRRPDSSVWYFGDYEPLNYTNSNSQKSIKPFKLQNPRNRKFVKLEAGSETGLNLAHLVALSADGKLERWVRGNQTPTDITPAGKTVVNFGIASFYGIIAVTADSLIFGRGFFNGTYVGQATHNTGWVDITSQWSAAGLTLPVKEIASSHATVHLIDSKDELFASGSNTMGNIGNGYERPNLKTPWGTSQAWSADISNNGLDMQAPVKVLAGKVKNIRAATTLSFQLYVQDMGNNWYSWGRNKAFSLFNGVSIGPYAGWKKPNGTTGVGNYADYPNAKDIPMPKKIANPLKPYTLIDFTVEGDPPPVVGAGINQYITTDTSRLYGIVHQQEFTITGITWSKLSGPAGGTIASPASYQTAITGLTAGTYKYQLSATNSAGLTSTDSVEIIVTSSNISPVVSAGAAQTITLPATTASLTGSASDADGTVSTYAWTKESGPAGGTISSPATATTSITALQPGTYTYKLTATDNSGGSAFSTVTITVLQAQVPNSFRTIDNWVTLTPPLYMQGNYIAARPASIEQDGFVTKEFMQRFEQMNIALKKFAHTIEQLRGIFADKITDENL